MRSSNQIDVILMIELVYDVSSEQVSSASGADTPAADVVGIAPHEVAHGAVMWDLLLAVEASNLVQGVY